MILTLNNLTSAGKKKKRIGRGGSRGGTSGSGHKGQKARSGGKIAAYFEGGQMSLSRRLPKRGFTNARFKLEFKIINLDQLESFFEEGTVVDKALLKEKGIIKSKSTFKLKVLGSGSLSKKLTIVADAFSAKAMQIIENLGGKAQLTKES